MAHRAHFEVMFRPDLYRGDDPALLAAKDDAFDVLFRAVEGALDSSDPAEVLATTIAAWSQAHGLAVLWINGNLPDDFARDAYGVASHTATGIVRLGDITRRQMAGALASLRTGGAKPGRQGRRKPEPFGL
jgi:hypothetical protein